MLFPDIMNTVTHYPDKSQRIHLLMELAGCKFDSRFPDIIVESSVGIATIGGIPYNNITPEIANALKTTMGNAGQMSYLAPNKHDGLGAYNTIAGMHGHTSIGHTVSIGIFVAGVTCAVENEWNSQRDHLHLSRITEARTAIQISPPWVALDPSMVSTTHHLRAHTLTVIQELLNKQPKISDIQYERINNLHAACKATAFLATGSLRNWQRVVSARHDTGKEHEYRNTLEKIHALLSPHFPEFFTE